MKYFKKIYIYFFYFFGKHAKTKENTVPGNSAKNLMWRFCLLVLRYRKCMVVRC